MRKFNAADWDQIDPNKSHHSIPQGRLWLRSTLPALVFVQHEGVEALAGAGTQIDLLVDSGEFRVEAPKGARVYLYSPFVPTFEPSGEVFTNADRMPLESGSLAEVRRELRMWKIEQMQRARAAAVDTPEPSAPVAAPAPEKVAAADTPEPDTLTA